MPHESIIDVLGTARDLGFLGPGPLEAHLQHAQGFADAAATLGVPEPRRCADLGSGGGVPGLVLALRWQRSSWVLVEAMVRRSAFLREAAARLGIAGRVEVVEGRAEVYGREHRAEYDLVTARGFGPPAVTAECASPLLRLSGTLMVSEPPGGEPDRWPAAGLGELGMEVAVILPGPPALAVIRQHHTCPDRYPRRTGVPGKRPLF